MSAIALIAEIWIGRREPGDIPREQFPNQEQYELYELVKSYYYCRQEIESLRNGISDNKKLRDAVMYQTTILANLEEKIEKILLGIR